MKRIFWMFIAMMLLLSLFAGCGQADTPSTQAQADSGTASSSGGTVPGSQGPANTTVDPPLDDTLLHQDPERDIYIFFDNHNSTIYSNLSSVPFVSFHILSVNELNLDEISLSLPIESSYVVSKKEIKLDGTVRLAQFTQCTQNQFPYELYQYYAGKDFAKLRQLEQAYIDARNAYELVRDDIEKWEAAKAAYEAAEAEFNAYYYAEKETYESLTMADLPQFHVYFVYAHISPMIEGESFTEATLTIEGQIYTQNIGQITLKKRTDRADELDWYLGDFTYATHGCMGEGNAPLPYNNGIHCVDHYFSFTADKTMTLTGLVPDDPEHAFLAALVEIQTFDGFQSSFVWNLTDPIDLYEGDSVIINVVYRDEAAAQISYYTKLWGYLEYQCVDGSFIKMAECEIYPKLNFYIMYAILFQGLDLESYYRDYYYPTYEPWRQEIGG